MGLKLETGEFYLSEELSSGIQAPYDYLSKENCRLYFQRELRQLQVEGVEASHEIVLQMAREGARVIDELDGAELFLRFRIASNSQKEAFKKEANGRLRDLEAYYQELLVSDEATV